MLTCSTVKEVWAESEPYLVVLNPSLLIKISHTHAQIVGNWIIPLTLAEINCASKFVVGVFRNNHFLT